MEMTSIFIGLLLGVILGGIIIYFILKSSNVSRNIYEEVNSNLIKSSFDLENSKLKINELEKSLIAERDTNSSQSEILLELKNQISRISAENDLQNRQISSQTETNLQQSTEIRELMNEKQLLLAAKSELSAKNQSLQELLISQKQEIEKMQENAKNEFKNLANEILTENSKKFSDANKENLDTILKPLGENLENFKKRVNEVYENEARERFSLNNVIKLMMEQTGKISQEANNLATALKGQSKTQGDWGEMILERILEDSGLSKNREYFTQFNIKNDEGENQRPDFILKLPGNQIVIIDSKVSLNAYERMTNAETEQERQNNLQLHISAIKRHIDSLSQKRYDNVKESLDFTIMFIPIEPAFLVAVQNDSQLWNYAYHKHIILLSPTNLIAYLKLISDVWKRADQNANAEEIARQAGALYDKFEGFVTDLIRIGKKMDEAKGDYENAMKKLSTGRGNLVKSSQKLKELGASTKKSLPEALIERGNNTSEIDFNTEIKS